MGLRDALTHSDSALHHWPSHYPLPVDHRLRKHLFRERLFKENWDLEFAAFDSRKA